jgi:hypothetical protein
MKTEQDKIIKHISLIKFKDPRIIQSIVYYPFFFAKQKMADPDDYRPIRIRYFGAFVGKYMRNKLMYKKLSYVITALKTHPKLFKIFIDPKFTNEADARKYVNKLFDDNNKEALETIYDAVYKAIEKV